MQQNGKYAALIRGINVGSANRVAMSDLREIMQSLGCAEVQTLLNSGNAVFSTAPVKRAGSSVQRGELASRIETALGKKLGVRARVVVLSAAELDVIVRENSLAKLADNPSRLQVAVTASAADLAPLDGLRKESWGQEKLAVGSRAAYLWCPQGVIKSALYKAVDRALADSVTARNWATVQKLHRLLEA